MLIFKTVFGLFVFYENILIVYLLHYPFFRHKLDWISVYHNKIQFHLFPLVCMKIRKTFNIIYDIRDMHHTV